MRWKRAVFALVLVCVSCLSSPGTEAAERPRDSRTVWMGVLIDDESLDGGIHLVAVVPGGPAERAGLERGDVLLEADGLALVRSEDLERVLARSAPGDTLTLQLLRAGRSLDRTVELAPPREVSFSGAYAAAARASTDARGASRAQAAPAASSAALVYGFSVAEVTPDLRVFYGAPPDLGVLVTGVRPGRTAHRAGLRVGDVLVELGPVRVDRAADLDDALENFRHRGRPLVARVVRDSLETAVRFGPPVAAESGPERREASVELLTLERSIESEIDRLERRLAELERRLKRLREDRRAGD